MTLTRDSILGAKDWASKVVEVPEWNGSVRVRTMRVRDQEAYMNAISARSESQDVRGLQLMLVVASCCADDGTPLFTAEDVEALADRSWPAIARVVAVAQELNGMTLESLEAAKGESSLDR